MKILVTTPNYDDIGEILREMDIQFSQFKDIEKIDCDLLFMNCGTSDIINNDALRNFIKNGGIFYASDLTSTFLMETFPNIFIFNGYGEICTLNAEIVDSRLIEYIGKNISITFDLSGWSMLEYISSGKVILRRTDTGKPLMVEIPYGKGRIYYTSFHNYAQASEKEIALLKILILTQLSIKEKKSIKDTADKINFNVDKIKEKYGEKKENVIIQKEVVQKAIVNNQEKLDNIIFKWDKLDNSQKENTSLPDINSTIDKF